jgi:hypothetical protein
VDINSIEASCAERKGHFGMSVDALFA